MERYRVKYRYGAGTSGETVLELQGGSESEALSKLRKMFPSDVQVVSYKKLLSPYSFSTHIPANHCKGHIFVS